MPAFFSKNFPLFSKIFTKPEAEHVLRMCLKYPKNRASCSYKLGSYEKKECIAGSKNKAFANRPTDRLFDQPDSQPTNRAMELVDDVRN